MIRRLIGLGLIAIMTGAAIIGADIGRIIIFGRGLPRTSEILSFVS